MMELPISDSTVSADAALREEARNKAQEVFDNGIYAALDLCRHTRLEGGSYNPFDAFEQRIILLALRATAGNQLRAARLIGINRSTLRKRMKKHLISVGTRIIGKP